VENDDSGLFGVEASYIGIDGVGGIIDTGVVVCSRNIDIRHDWPANSLWQREGDFSLQRTQLLLQASWTMVMSGKDKDKEKEHLSRRSASLQD